MIKKDIHLNNIDSKIQSYPKFEAELKDLKKYYEESLNLIYSRLSVKDFKGATDMINNYKEYIQEKNEIFKFTSQSKFESTVLESFVSVILNSVLNNNNMNQENIFIGSQKNYSKMLFTPSNYSDFCENLKYVIDVKDQDASISRKVTLDINGNKQEISVPIVAIECKTYIDKTMLEGAFSTATKIKSGNPHCYFAIVCESYEVKLENDVVGSSLNQIFVIKKTSKKKDRAKAKYHYDVIEKIYKSIEKHLKNSWGDTERKLNEEGILFYE